MRLPKRPTAICAAALLTWLTPFRAGGIALAGDILPPKTLKAVAQSLSFLESGPDDGTFALAVVYSPTTPSASVEAAEISRKLSKLQGPKRTRLAAAAYSADALFETRDRIDGLLVLTAPGAEADALAAFIKRQRVLSVSSDPTCLAIGTCVLLIKTGRSVDITLNTGLASDVGAEFSSVFTMMVTRR